MLLSDADGPQSLKNGHVDGQVIECNRLSTDRADQAAGTIAQECLQVDALLVQARPRPHWHFHHFL
jgi:hypothetical protein